RFSSARRRWRSAAETRRSSSTCRDNRSTGLRSVQSGQAGRPWPTQGRPPPSFSAYHSAEPIRERGGSPMTDQSEKADQADRVDEELLVSGERPLSIPNELPVLPLRDTVLFPNSFMPLAVAREASVRLIDEATSSGRMIGVFTQREAAVEEPLL